MTSRPNLVEAIMYSGGGGRSKAQQVHAAFLAHYGRTAAQTPLLHFTGHGFQDAS